MTMNHCLGEEGRKGQLGSVAATAGQRRCRCGLAHHCDQLLDAIHIPDEDSRLQARACIDFGQVQLGEALSAAIAGNFNIRIHVPRALQQQITGNGLVGSVLGSARISADISERVGMAPGACGDTDICLFVGFHEARRGSWLADLCVVRGSRLRVPVRIDATIVKQELMLPTGIVPVALQFETDVTASCAIAVPSGAVGDLWRSVREPVRKFLARHLESAAKTEWLRLRTALRTSLRSEPNEGALERSCRVAWSAG